MGNQVNESTQVGSVVLKMKAQDLDKGYNGFLSFVVSAGDEMHGAWDIKTSENVALTGGTIQEANLILVAPLDREEISSYILNITVWDQGESPKHTSRLLSVKVSLRSGNFFHCIL